MTCSYKKKSPALAPKALQIKKRKNHTKGKKIARKLSPQRRCKSSSSSPLSSSSSASRAFRALAPVSVFSAPLFLSAMNMIEKFKGVLFSNLPHELFQYALRIIQPECAPTPRVCGSCLYVYVCVCVCMCVCVRTIYIYIILCM